MRKSLKESDIRLKEQGNLYLRVKGVIIGKVLFGSNNENLLNATKLKNER